VSQSSPTPAAPTFEKVGTLADLKEGQLLIEKESKFAPVLLIQDAKDAKVVYAVDPTCPHAGCTVEHKAGGTELACPCHGSKFGLDGAVTKGPAKKPLPTYAVKLEGDTILLAKAT
jgi:cytochrome b6-f complex iron-sulfur subunit